MSYQIRKYQEEDFQQVLSLCQKSFIFDEISEDILREKIDADPFYDKDLLWLTCDCDQIIGFMMGTYRMDIRGINYGYIKLMVVDETYRRRGIARRMYQLIEDMLGQRNIDVMRLGDVPMNYFMPGIDPRYTPALCFAMRMGFERFSDTSNLLVDLSQQNWEVEINEEIEVKRADKNDRSEVFELIGEHWALWRYELEMAYQNQPVSIHIAKEKRKVKAFSAHSANNKSMPWFGPMGTHPDLRGKGVGKKLLFECLKDLKEKAFQQAIIPWVGPIDFYAHHTGAKVDRVFWRYEKEIK
jgi:GNAT superfamily N-acetyltransferase